MHSVTFMRSDVIVKPGETSVGRHGVVAEKTRSHIMTTRRQQGDDGHSHHYLRAAASTCDQTLTTCWTTCWTTSSLTTAQHIKRSDVAQ